MKPTLMYKMNRLAADLRNSFEWINAGGCCPVAAMMADALQQLGVPDVRVLVIDERGQVNIDDNLRAGMYDTNDGFCWNEEGIYFHHVMVGFELHGEQMAWDTEHGVGTARELSESWGCYIGDLTYEEAASISQDDIWSYWFDRGQLPGIACKIKSQLLEN